jgi:hypothetical protein
MRTIISKSGLVFGNFARLLHQLQIAAGVRIRSRFLVGVGRRQNHVGDVRGFGQEHILHHHKTFREHKGIDAQTADRIRAHHVKRFQLAGLRRLDHLRQAQAFFGGQLAPFLLELLRAGDRFVSRQQIGIKPHFAGPAGIRVIAQADQLCSGQSCGKTHQLLDVRPRSSEPKAMTIFCSARIFSRSAIQASRAGRRPKADQRIKLGIVAAKKCDCLRFRARRKQTESRRLPPQLDGRRVDDVKLRPPQAHVRPDLPCQQRMLIRGIVADQQNRGRIQHVAHGSRFPGLPCSAAARAGKSAVR